MSGLWAAALVAGSSIGCATSGSSFDASGYRQTAFGYAVAFQDAGAKSMSGPDWQLDNHRYDDSTHMWEEKKGENYVATRERDLNQDGTISFDEKSEEPIYDLRLVSKKDNGIIWVKAHPFLPEHAEQDLEVILDNYVDSLSGHGLYAQGNLFSIERTKARNYTTFLVAKNIQPLASRNALTGTIEIAEVDRLKTDPTHRKAIIKLVLLKIRCLTAGNCRVDDVNETGSSPDSANPELQRWPIVDCKGKPCRARSGLLILGYSNTPAYFASGLPEFEGLIKRVSFPEAEPLPLPPLRETAKTPATAAAPAPGPPAAAQPPEQAPTP